MTDSGGLFFIPYLPYKAHVVPTTVCQISVFCSYYSMSDFRILSVGKFYSVTKLIN